MYGYALWEGILIAYDLYANKCKKQYEKFGYYADKVPFTWADCEAAYNLVVDVPHVERWRIIQEWRRSGAYPPDDYDPRKQALEAL